MRGGVESPVTTGAHGSVYSTLFDRNEWRSTELCGACHDFQNRLGAHVHRTLTEWTESLFADTSSRLFLTCNGCHLGGRPAPIATGDLPERRLHDHTMPGLNVALTDWPEKEAQRAAILADLTPAVLARLCLTAGLRPQVSLDNVMGGHMWPSGDASTRRAWVELVVRSDDKIVYQSGVVAEGTPVVATRSADPDLWLLADRLVGEDGEDVVFPWAAKAADSSLLPPSVTADPTDPRFYHAVTRLYPPLVDVPDEMTMKLHIRPIALEMLDALVASGDLAADVRALLPTFTASEIEWQGKPGTCVPPINPSPTRSSP